MIASRHFVLLLLPLVACGPGLIGAGGSMLEEEGSELPANMTLDDSEFTDTLPIDFPRTYADQSEYFYHAGFCSEMASNMALALITIARQVHHDTINVIDPSGVYQTGADKRLYIGDMGGCPETNPDSPDYNPYEHHHDDGGNFHKGTRVSDFLYFTREANNCTQSNCNGLGHTSLYNSNQLIESRVDWLRTALLLRYLNEIFPQANIMVGTQLVAYISEMLRTNDPALRGLLEELALDGYSLRVQGNDAYNHPHHMHVGFSAAINWDNFAGDHWYFNSSEDGSYQLVDARTIARSGNHGILYPIHNAAGAFGGYPQRCDGAFEINTRGAIWESECPTGWQALTQPECDELGLECPRTSGADTLPTSITCIGRTCMGIDSFVDEIRRPDGTSNRDGLAPEDYQRYCCSGVWHVDATTAGDPADWETGCSTGWHKVGIVGEPDVTPFGTLIQFQECSAPSVDEPPVDEPPVDEPPVDEPPVDEPPVDEPPVDEPPVDEPPVDEPPVDEPPVDEPPVDEPPVDEPPVNECSDGNCGTPTSCSLDTECASDQQCESGLCVATPATPTVPTVRSCTNRLCWDADNDDVVVVFPVVNAANTSNRYPATCTGSYAIDVRGGSWTSTCSTGWEVATSCERPDGGTFANCPYPTTNTFNEVSCVDNLCRGSNSDVHPVANATGMSNGDLIATCTGSWWIDARGSTWESHCDSGWTTR